jgi:hypothetical protein
MKKLIITGLFALASTVSLFAQSAATQQIVDKHIEAIGGAEAWSKVENMIAKATIKSQGAEIGVTSTQVQNKALRVDIQVMGMNGYQIITNKEGWGFMPFAGQTKPEPMTADDLKNAQEELDMLDEYITYKAKGKKLEDLGKDEVEGTECYKLKLTSADGKVSTSWIDVETYQIIKQVETMQANGKEVEATSTYSNYKKLDNGIVFPMNVNSSQTGPMEFTSVAINQKIDDTIFTVKP